MDLQINPPEGLEVFDVSGQNVIELWSKVKDKEILFSDLNKGSFFLFARALMDSIIFQNKYGIIRIAKIVPFHRCELHGFVLGTSLSRFKDTMKDVILWIFDNLQVSRIECRVPDRALTLQKFLVKIGFEKEGVLRNRLMIGGSPEDEIVYSIIRR